MAIARPQLLRIGQLAKSAGVNVQTIRFYESEGLLAPPSRTASGYRAYTVSDLEAGRSAPVVFGHGSIGDAAYWTDQIAAFGKWYRAIAYSRRYNFPNTNPAAPCGPQKSNPRYRMDQCCAYGIMGGCEVPPPLFWEYCRIWSAGSGFGFVSADPWRLRFCSCGGSWRCMWSGA